MELLSGDRLGKYEIVGRLAAGGMAEVYLARAIGVGGFAKTVALKRMLPDLAQEPGFREMFMHEASIVSRLNHANIVQIFDFAEERGELYLAMEFVHGVTLRQLLRDVVKPPARADQNGPRMFIPPMLAAHIGRGIARALAHAWQAPDENGQPSRLIHRDVSPHNVLLSYDGDVKLADFGIAKPVDRRTSVGTIKGKLVYMAPEQITGGTLDARTDVFALGIVLYETATNRQRALFEGASQREVMQAIHKRQIPPPDRMDPDFPKSFSAVILKALERDPEKRFQSAAELADALGECIHREARSPQDVDLGAFMRQVYGEPQPVRGLRPVSQPPTPAPAPPNKASEAVTPQPSPAEREVARISNDPHAETLTRGQLEELMRQLDAEAPEDVPGDPTRIDRQVKTIAEALDGAGTQSEARTEAMLPASRGRPYAVVAAAIVVIGALALLIGRASIGTQSTEEVHAEANLGPTAVQPPEMAAAGALVAAEAPSEGVVASQTNAAVGAPVNGSNDPPEPEKAPEVAAGIATSGRPSSDAAGTPKPSAAEDAVAAAQPASPAGETGAATRGAKSAQPASGTSSAKADADAASGPAKPRIRKTAKKAPVGKGSLWVQVTPWAFVAIDDGKKEEVAPAKLFDSVPAGVRVIELSNDAGFSRKLKVTVRPGEQARLIGTIQDARQVR